MCVRVLRRMVAWTYVQTMNVNYTRGAVLVKNKVCEEEVSQEVARRWPLPNDHPDFQLSSMQASPRDVARLSSTSQSGLFVVF